jgi:hypothetical protein
VCVDVGLCPYRYAYRVRGWSLCNHTSNIHKSICYIVCAEPTSILRSLTNMRNPLTHSLDMLLSHLIIEHSQTLTRSPHETPWLRELKDKVRRTCAKANSSWRRLISSMVGLFWMCTPLRFIGSWCGCKQSAGIWGLVVVWESQAIDTFDYKLVRE